MKDLIYKISIDASKEDVWNTIIGSETYDQWVKAFSPLYEVEVLGNECGGYHNCRGRGGGF